jgi:hypothetical protein
MASAILIVTFLALSIVPLPAHAADDPVVDFFGWGQGPGPNRQNPTIYWSMADGRVTSLAVGAEAAAPVSSKALVEVDIDASHVAPGVTVTSAGVSQGCAGTMPLDTCGRIYNPGDINNAGFVMTVSFAPDMKPGLAGYVAYTVVYPNDLDPSNNSGRVTIDVLSSNQTRLIFGADVQNAPVGGTATVTVTIFNGGPNTDTNDALLDLSTSPDGSARAVAGGDCAGSPTSCASPGPLRAGQSISWRILIKVLSCGDRRETPSFIGVGWTFSNDRQMSTDSLYLSGVELHPLGCGIGSNSGSTIVAAPAATGTPTTSPTRPSSAPTDDPVTATASNPRPEGSLAASSAGASPTRTIVVLAAALIVVAFAVISVRATTARRRRRVDPGPPDPTTH